MITEIREIQTNIYIQKIIIPSTHHQLQKFKIRKLRQKKKIISTSFYLHQHTNNCKTTKIQKSRGLVNKNRNMINTSKMINIDNTNVRDNNNIGTNKEQYRHQQNNKTNNHTGEKQIIEEEKYRSKTFRHLRSIESRIKKDQHPKHQSMHKRTRTQHQKIRKQPATKKHDHPTFKKRTKFIFRMYQNTVVPI